MATEHIATIVCAVVGLAVGLVVGYVYQSRTVWRRLEDRLHAVAVELGGMLNRPPGRGKLPDKKRKALIATLEQLLVSRVMLGRHAPDLDPSGSGLPASRPGSGAEPRGGVN